MYHGSAKEAAFLTLKEGKRPTDLTRGGGVLPIHEQKFYTLAGPGIWPGNVYKMLSGPRSCDWGGLGDATTLHVDCCPMRRKVHNSVVAGSVDDCAYHILGAQVREHPIRESPKMEGRELRVRGEPLEMAEEEEAFAHEKTMRRIRGVMSGWTRVDMRPLDLGSKRSRAWLVHDGLGQRRSPCAFQVQVQHVQSSSTFAGTEGSLTTSELQPLENCRNSQTRCLFVAHRKERESPASDPKRTISTIELFRKVGIIPQSGSSWS